MGRKSEAESGKGKVVDFCMPTSRLPAIQAHTTLSILASRVLDKLNWFLYEVLYKLVLPSVHGFFTACYAGLEQRGKGGKAEMGRGKREAGRGTLTVLIVL